MSQFWQLLLSIAASSGITLSAAWLAKSWLGARIANDVKHTYDARLETLKNDLRVQADISASIERRLDSGEEFVRSSAARLTLERRKGAMSHQLESLKEIWGIVSSFRELGSLASNLGAMDMTWFAGLQPSERKEIMSVFLREGTIQKFNLAAGEKYRPFVPQEVYKVYAASVACAAFVMGVAVTRKSALDSETLSRKFVSDALEGVLPGRFAPSDLQSDLLQVAEIMRELEDLGDQLIRSHISGGEDVDVESVSRVAKGSLDAMSLLRKQQIAGLRDAKDL